MSENFPLYPAKGYTQQHSVEKNHAKITINIRKVTDIDGPGDFESSIVAELREDHLKQKLSVKNGIVDMLFYPRYIYIYGVFFLNIAMFIRDLVLGIK